MIYLIDRRFTIEGTLEFLGNIIKCPKVYDKCFCFSCKFKGKVEVNDNQGTSFADGNDNYNVNHGTCFADAKVDGKQESFLYDDDDTVCSKARDPPTKQRVKPCSQCGCGCGCGGAALFPQ